MESITNQARAIASLVVDPDNLLAVAALALICPVLILLLMTVVVPRIVKGNSQPTEKNGE